MENSTKKSTKNKEKKALLIGYFSERNRFNGETTKGLAVKGLLEDVYDKLVVYNTENSKKYPIRAMFRLVKSLKGIDDVFLCVGNNGFNYLTRIISFLAPRKRLFLMAVGPGPIFSGIEIPEGKERTTIIDECIKAGRILYKDSRFKSNKKLLAKHTLIFFESESLRYLYENHYKINNGSVLTNFRNFPILNDVHAPFNSGERTKFVFFSQILKEKGIFDLLTVVEEMHREGRQFSLTIAGKGPEESVNRVKEIADRLGNVDFVGPISDYPVKFLSSFDCQLLPTHQDGIPGSLVESLFAGTPIITSSFAFCHDVVPDGGGIIFEIRSRSGLKNAMTEFLKLGKEEREKMSAKCLEFAKTFTKEEAEEVLKRHL